MPRQVNIQKVFAELEAFIADAPGRDARRAALANLRALAEVVKQKNQQPVLNGQEKDNAGSISTN